MGIPLEQCKQTFQWMGAQYRQNLRNRFVEFKDLFGLEDLFYGSFVRNIPFEPQVSAADVALVINALLMTPTPIAEGQTAEGDASGSTVGSIL